MVGPGRQERSWIRGAQGGSASDLEALFKEHWPRAHRAAYLVVQDGAAAEDIAQEAFLSAVRNLDRFDRRRVMITCDIRTLASSLVARSSMMDSKRARISCPEMP